MLIFAILIVINILTWYPILSFWFFQSWEATWLIGNCGLTVNPICLMQGHSLLYYLDYRIFGWNPWGWYLTTLILHIGAVYLGYLLLLKLTKEKLFSFIVALIFGVNITYYDVLTWGSFNGLYALMMVFFLLSSLFYIKFVEGKNKMLWYFFIPLLLLIGLFVRESALILPAFLILGYVYKKGFQISRKDMLFLLKSLLPLVLVLVFYFLIRKVYGGPTYDYIDETVQYRVRLLSQGLFLEYIRRVFLLVGLLIAPQAIPFSWLNTAREIIAVHFHPKFINLYFFPLSGYIYVLFQLVILFKNWSNKKIRNLLLFGLLWTIIPTLSASLPISFTDEVFQRPYNLNTPTRWRYFAFFGTSIYWVTAFWSLYTYCLSFVKTKKQYTDYAFAVLLLGVIVANSIALHVIENNVYISSYKPEKEFYLAFQKAFPTLPTNYFFYVYPSSGSLKDYMSEWYHVRNFYYPNLKDERGVSWEESHMAMLFQRFLQGSANLNNTFFITYDSTRGFVDKTAQAKKVITHMQPYSYNIDQQFESTQSSNFSKTHQIVLPLQPQLPVEIPYTVRLTVTANAQDTASSVSDMRAYVQDRIDFLQHSTVKVCGTSPIGNKPAYHLDPNHLIDGNIGARSFWVADCRPAWIVIDLEKEKDIAGIAFHTTRGPQMPANYMVEVSNDGKNWKSVEKVNNNTQAQRIDLWEKGVKARYIKFDVIQTVEGSMLALDELEVLGEDARIVASQYGNDFEKMISDSYSKGGVFVRFSWETNPNNFTYEDTIRNNSYYTALLTDGQEHVYTIQPNEGEYFSNTDQFLSRFITAMDLDFVGLPSSVTVSRLDITPRFTLPMRLEGDNQ